MVVRLIGGVAISVLMFAVWGQPVPLTFVVASVRPH